MYVYNTYYSKFIASVFVLTILFSAIGIDDPKRVVAEELLNCTSQEIQQRKSSCLFESNDTTSTLFLPVVVGNDNDDMVQQIPSGNLLMNEDQAIAENRPSTNENNNVIRAADTSPWQSIDGGIAYWGRVGISTSDPKENFQIGNDKGITFHNSGNKALSFNAAFVPGSGWQYLGEDSAGQFLMDYQGTDTVQIRVASQGNTGSTISWNTAATFTSDGDVGIGTMQPQSKLAVNGTITAKEIKVTNSGWADYVFADDYELRPLSEVATFIETNRHLPGIPTAEEVEANGILVGDSQRMMLEKIEELTLYLIALESRVSELESENIQLRTKGFHLQ